MAAAARVDGQEKVIAAAQQIVKSLATSKNAADDMIRILSGFDNRLSSIHIFPSSSASAPGSVGEFEDDGGETPRASASELRLSEAEEVVLRWEASNLNIWDAASATPAAHVDAVDEYLSAVDELISLSIPADEAGDTVLADRTESVLQTAMSRLEEEFRYLMARNAAPLDPNGLHFSMRRISLSFASDGGEASLDDFETDDEQRQAQQTPQRQEGSPEERSGSSLMDDRNIDLIQPEAVVDLKAIADRMIWAKYDWELRQVYCSVRRETLDECLSVLGVDRMSIEEVQRMEWQMLDDKIKKWIQAAKTTVRVLLTGEKRLCNHILAGSEELKEECFMEIAKGCTMQLLNFGDAIAICPRSSEKLFRILDMYETLADVLPDLQELFSGDPTHLISEEAVGILKRLGDAVRGTLSEFESAVQKETSRRPMLGGEIHPVTRYVMNYVRLLVVYSDSLDTLLDDGENGPGDEFQADDRNHSLTPLGRRLLLIISYLESNLEEKSKLYEDGAMQCIFFINNIHYIVQKVKDSELGKLLGDNWVRKRRGKVRQYATSYLRASWTRLLSHLKDDGIGSGSSSSVSKVALKERFKNFNLAFEEIYRVQTGWKVPDPQLREELRISISEKVIPAYRFFMGRFSGQLDGRSGAKYIKYSAEDLENYLSDLFEGLPRLPSHPRRNT